MAKPTCVVRIWNRTIRLACVRPMFVDNASWFGPEFPDRSGGTAGTSEVLLRAGAEIMVAIEPLQPEEAFKGGVEVAFDDARVGIEFSLLRNKSSYLSATSEGLADASTSGVVVPEHAYYIVEITRHLRRPAHPVEARTEFPVIRPAFSARK